MHSGKYSANKLCLNQYELQVIFSSFFVILKGLNAGRTYLCFSVSVVDVCVKHQ